MPLVEERGGVRPPEEEKVEEAHKELDNINLHELPPIKEGVRQLDIIWIYKLVGR